MTQKQFTLIRIFSIAIVAGGISFSVTTGNWYLPGLLLIAETAVLLILKRRVTDVTEDERDRKIAGKSALHAISFYAITAAIVGTTLIIIGRDNQSYGLIGNIILYNACTLVILYALLFKFYARKQDRD